MQQRQLEELPEDSKEAMSFINDKLIKNMGEAKTLSIRLTGVKHQEKLSALACPPGGCRNLHG